MGMKKKNQTTPTHFMMSTLISWDYQCKNNMLHEENKHNIKYYPQITAPNRNSLLFNTKKCNFPVPHQGHDRYPKIFQANPHFYQYVKVFTQFSNVTSILISNVLNYFTSWSQTSSTGECRVYNELSTSHIPVNSSSHQHHLYPFFQTMSRSSFGSLPLCSIFQGLSGTPIISHFMTCPNQLNCADSIISLRGILFNPII